MELIDKIATTCPDLISLQSKERAAKVNRTKMTITNAMVDTSSIFSVFRENVGLTEKRRDVRVGKRSLGSGGGQFDNFSHSK